MLTNAVDAPTLSLDALYRPGAASKVREARILVVGAGGVGCELVKNLALSRFGQITLIDLDTIDVSNLNRQFLFRRKHVGKSKAIEAAAAVRAMVPGTNIEGIMGNVKETRFGVVFFKGFTLVCNALDNLEARRHVNRMCLAAGVPLVESGSTGYNGQCSVIGKGVECYDCVERPPQKTYAVCTIRSTPDKPVHCIVWAKFLYHLVFGADDDGNVLKDLDGGGAASPQENGIHEGPREVDANGDKHQPDISPEAEQHNSEPSVTKRRPKAKRVRYVDTDTPDSFAKRVCERVFVDDIEEQRAMKDLWTDREPPVAYDVSAVADEHPVDLEEVDLLDQTEWGKERSASIFKATLTRIAKSRSAEIGTLSFDKDDRDAMMFVASAANLRANAYGVQLQSPFAAKGIAGNIVHAIATTNAVVGGLIVLEAIKITTGDGNLGKSLTTFVSKAPRGSRTKKILCPEALQKPNKNCFVCSEGQLHLSLDVDGTSLRTLVTSVMQKKMSILQPGVHVTTGDYNNTLYECGAGLEEDEIEIYSANLAKSLRELRVENGSQLVVEDFAQNIRCTLHVSHVDKLLEENDVGERFILDGNVPEDKEDADGGTGAESEHPEEIEDDIEEVDVLQTGVETIMSKKDVADGKESSKKRQFAEAVLANGERETKKARVEEEA